MAQSIDDSQQLSLRSLRTIFPWISDLVDDDSITEIMILCRRPGRSGDAVLMFYEKAGDLHQLPVPEADERDVERLAMALTRPLGTDPSGRPRCAMLVSLTGRVWPCACVLRPTLPRSRFVVSPRSRSRRASLWRRARFRNAFWI